MDSKLLHIKANYLLSKVIWQKEWIHIGTVIEPKIALVENLLETFLIDEELFVIQNRQNSERKSRLSILNNLYQIANNGELQLWNIDLNKVIKFNPIGAVQMGEII